MDLSFEAARHRADERLNQELTRIRNLPKRSKITICNKHGLTHAHHMNTGLLKSLEVDLSILKRERRRVVNELNKKKKTFAETTQKSFPQLLPFPGKDVGIKKVVEKHQSPKRFKASWRQPQKTDYFDRQKTLKEQRKKSILIAITEQSKRQTNEIIQENIKKISYNFQKETPTGDGNFLTKLNNRGELRRSCFPSLFGGGASSPATGPNFKNTKYKADAYYKGTSYFMPEKKEI